MKHKFRWLSVLAAVAVVVAISVAAAGRGSTSSPTVGPAAVLSSSHDDVSTADGQMIAEHQTMTEQMRVNTTPGMLNLMDADPMWAQMRTDTFIQQQDTHQQQINQMLGLAPGDTASP